MKRVERCYECGKVMRRLYIRVSEVKAVHKGLLGEWREYKQQYKGFAWFCERCKMLVFADGRRDEYVLIPVKEWEKVKEQILSARRQQPPPPQFAG